MRLIFIYKYGIFQRKTERALIQDCDTTDKLLNFLQQKIGKAWYEFVVRIQKDKIPFRVVRGWPLDHYEITDGHEVEVDVPEREERQISRNLNNKYLMNLLGNTPTKLQNIAEEDEEAGNRPEQSMASAGSKETDGVQSKYFDVRKYLDEEIERLLKEVQKGTKERFLAVLNQYPENADEETILEIDSRKPQLINELGERGWGVVHYAVYCNKFDILQELVSREVQLNKCTTEGWLPIQIAVNRNNLEILKYLLAQKGVNVNEATSIGTALHVATSAKSPNYEVIQILLESGADFRITDAKGKTCLDRCTNQDIVKQIYEFDEKKQKIAQQQNLAQQIFLPSACLTRGSIIKVKSLLLTHSVRYMVLDPLDGSFIRYESEANYPKKPKEVIPVSNIKAVKSIKDKSWHMKDQYFYFEIYVPQRLIMACKHKKICDRWIKAIFDAMLLCQQLAKNPHLKESLEKTQLILDDENDQIVNPQLQSQKNSNQNPLQRKKTQYVFKKNVNKESVTENPMLQLPSSKSSMVTVGQADPNSSFSNNTNNTSNPPIPGLLGSTATTNSSQPHNLEHRKQEQQFTPSKNSNNNADMTAKELNESLNMLTGGQENKITFSSFEIQKTLGSGAFGKVFLVRHISSNKLYALKALRKRTLIVKKQLKYAISEANVLKKANHPFIINLFYAFQTPNYLYLALDYCPGKDLSFHLAREETFPEDDCRFYIAELLLAIEHLHQKNIIYRDLKSENILLDAEGHIKLADFGLSKDNIQDKTKSFCGSPAYLAPEMLDQKGVGKQVDLYGIGCVLYELLVGEPPYYSDDIPTLYSNIRTAKLKFPKGLSEESKSLISGLLIRDPSKRLGAKDPEAIRRHPFFANIDWAALEKKQLTPPQRKYGSGQTALDSEQQEEELLNRGRNAFTDNDYDDANGKINRLINFSFVKTE